MIEKLTVLEYHHQQNLVNMNNTSKIEVSKRTSALTMLNEFCTFSMGEREDKGDFLEVTEWANGEGYDVHIDDVNGKREFQLTSGQMEALKKCVKAIDKQYIK